MGFIIPLAATDGREWNFLEGQIVYMRGRPGPLDQRNISMYTENSRFEWNEDKAFRNLEKHGISFKEAATAFNDPHGLIDEDDAHSRTESRFRLTGESAGLILMVVAFTLRGDRIRIISARPSGWKERFRYEQERRRPL